METNPTCTEGERDRLRAASDMLLRAAEEVANNSFLDPERPNHAVYLVASAPMDRLRKAAAAARIVNNKAR